MARGRGSSSSRGFTVREGTGEKNWYVIAVYIALTIVLLLYSTWTYYKMGEMGASVAFAILFFVLAIGGLVSFGALFKDSAYLRGTAAGWNPKWWYYIGGPVAASIVVYAVHEATRYATYSGAMAFFTFAVAALVSNAYYLFNRHKKIGVP